MELTVQDFTDIIQALAVVAVAIPASFGLTTWRDQLIGKKKIELAEEALTLAYELQEVIQYARHPFSSGEGEKREGRENEPEGHRRSNDAIYSRIVRLSEYGETFAKLQTVRIRFRAYFNEQAQDELAVFNTVRKEIIFSAWELINNSTDLDEYPKDLRTEMRNTVWDKSVAERPDKIRQKVDSAVAEIERVCRPVLAKG